MKKPYIYCLVLVCGLAISLPAPEAHAAMAPLKKMKGKSKSGSKGQHKAGRSNGKSQPGQRGRVDNKGSRGSASRKSPSRSHHSSQRSKARQTASGKSNSSSAQRNRAKRSSIVGGEAYRPVPSRVPKGPKSPVDTRTAQPGKSILKRTPTKPRIGVPARGNSPHRSKPSDAQRLASRQERGAQRKKQTLKKLKGGNNISGTGQRTTTRGTGPKPAANNARLLTENAAKRTKGKRANPANRPGTPGLKRVARPNTPRANQRAQQGSQ